jgi:hypothetical protein
MEMQKACRASLVRCLTLWAHNHLMCGERVFLLGRVPQPMLHWYCRGLVFAACCHCNKGKRLTMLPLMSRGIINTQTSVGYFCLGMARELKSEHLSRKADSAT